ncbi:MAG: hypothetical protein QM688_04300 [Sphingomonas bacterium]
MTLQGQHAIVTGGGTGIGAMIAAALEAEDTPSPASAAGPSISARTESPRT